jgi:hypothetical protein
MKYSTDPKPSEAILASPAWRNWEGVYGFFGDSNVHFSNIKQIINTEAFNQGQGGSTPDYIKSMFDQITAHHKTNPIQKVYIQTGGNMWGSIPAETIEIFVESLTHQANIISKYVNDMTDIIKFFKKLPIAPENIIVASHPWVDPSTTIADWPTTIPYPKVLRNALAKINANVLFSMANALIAPVCTAENVKYMDIFSWLAIIWRQGYKKSLFSESEQYWWDKVHYDTRVRALQGVLIKQLWGI